ncbi:bll0878 [Bradyrhizobium diazoefficiens USDA 110]|uniref:Bll0878 protein n=1 Tax=Bradyrhizobium diazoefficiens (strain JCM 10833 / BCRC 13528 / IAM 13628 / NBRC 14792 / USDA 110) TaxID=224911 RepID=Q89W15_BRADU|nr:hypothetical protein Bdiaspc4_04220 [Bradyrhizobium diazoefficiens]BAC46143.1 bll0878 [Bradyrhizobium diazoefficiens USDA 110]
MREPARFELWFCRIVGEPRLAGHEMLQPTIAHTPTGLAAMVLRPNVPGLAIMISSVVTLPANGHGSLDRRFDQLPVAIVGEIDFNFDPHCSEHLACCGHSWRQKRLVQL